MRPGSGGHGDRLLDVSAAGARQTGDGAQGGGRERLVAAHREVGGEELAGFAADAVAQARREAGHRHHRRHAHRQAGDEEGEAAARAARLADQGAGVEAEGHRTTWGSTSAAGAIGLGAAARSSRSTRPSRRWIWRPASAATAGSWVTSTRVVPSRAPQLGQQLQDPAAGGAVEVAGGLVGEQDRRPGGEGAGEGDPLLLAPRELARIVMAALRQPHGGQQLVGASEGVGEAEQLDRQQHVLARGEVRQQLEALEDEADLLAAEQGEAVLRHRLDGGAVDQDLARGRAVEAGHQGEERRLAAPRGAEDGDELAGLDREIDMVEDRQLPAPRGEPAGELAQFNAGTYP